MKRRIGELGWCLGAVCAALAGSNNARAVDLAVVSVSPTPRTVIAPTNSSITVHFDKPVKPESIVMWRSFWAFGRSSGTVAGSFQFSNGNQTVSLVPNRPFFPGDNFMVILSHDVEATDNTKLRSGGYSFQFWTKAGSAAMQFVEIDRMTTRSIPSQPSRAYGGLTADLDHDGFLDMTIVNEITADLRVYRNKADHSGLFFPFSTPTAPTGNGSSPNDTSDFNRDGHVDACTANLGEDTISVVLGNGDGTFASQQLISVGNQPRGIAAFDVDGDGDVDLVNANYLSDNMSRMLNNGMGVFGAPSYFEGGVDEEWSVNTADMNQDGLLDLIIGSEEDAEIVVSLSNGNGTFTPMTPVDSGGTNWMMAIGDLDGNGTEDVTSAYNGLSQGGVLLGDGTGNLSAPVFYSIDSAPVATDLGDLDGDGDLDWVTSSYSGRWNVFKNNGAGAFNFDRDFDAPAAASCALIFDFDNDGDLDLGLIDEVDDEVILEQNSGFNPVVPAVSAWGLGVMVLLLATAGSIKLTRAFHRAAAQRGIGN